MEYTKITERLEVLSKILIVLNRERDRDLIEKIKAEILLLLDLK